MADEIIGKHVNEYNLHVEAKNKECRLLVDKLEHLVSHPKEGTLFINKLEPINKLSKEYYYYGCSEFNDFMKRQNVEGSKIKFKTRDDDIDHMPNHVKSISTYIDIHNKSIIYVLDQPEYWI